MKHPKMPIIYQNWQDLSKNSDDENRISFSEFPLYSDADEIDGQITNDECPYNIINPCVPNKYKHKNYNLMRPLLILRIKYYNHQNENHHKNKKHTKNKQTEKINYDEYLRSNIADQIAVLASLVLGIRLKAGGVNRIFDNEKDTFGRPVAYFHNNFPPQFIHENNYEALPSALKCIHKKDTYFNIKKFNDYLLSIIKLDPKNIELLIRAAKLYRDAIWLIESETQLSWIMLVSAIEVIAQEKDERPDSTPIEIFQRDHEKLFKDIKSLCDEKLLNTIAKTFVDKKNVCRKYKLFLSEFLPKPPSIRPPQHLRINWDDLKINSNTKNPLMQIYEYRSNYLHTGQSFPQAGRLEHDFAEKPSESYIFIDNEYKMTKNLPLTINTFEYIVRNAILGWWNSIKEENNRI